MKPIIGITCSQNDEKKQLFINRSYTEAVLKFGGFPVILPYISSVEDAKQILCRLDGVIFSGGVDVDPKEYNEETLPECGSICRDRDISEKCYFEGLKSISLPVLGICRGLQSLNVFAGGSLFQDIPSQIPENPGHSGTKHTVNIKKDSILYDILQTEKTETNSFHHQAIKQPASGYEICAFSDDGIAEAIYSKTDKRFLALQYHPEMLVNENEDAAKIFRWFIGICGEKHPEV